MQEQMERLATALEPYPWAYTSLMLAALLLLAWLANFITKKVLLRALRRVLGMLPGLRGSDASRRCRCARSPGWPTWCRRW